jgi:3-hydroxymyristoyl/3-hydroxydecanoyl-(acyl carrier protein) dehydratase
VTADPTRPEVLDVVAGPTALKLKLYVPATLQWFRGHFPEQPILPGVVQLAWAMGFARERFALDPAVEKIVELKFLRVIRPGAELELELAWSAGERELGFRFRQRESTCSSGRFILAQ